MISSSNDHGQTTQKPWHWHACSTMCSHAHKLKVCSCSHTHSSVHKMYSHTVTKHYAHEQTYNTFKSKEHCLYTFSLLYSFRNDSLNSYAQGCNGAQNVLLCSYVPFVLGSWFGKFLVWQGIFFFVHLFWKKKKNMQPWVTGHNSYCIS